MKCRSCENELHESMVYCPYCGIRVKKRGEDAEAAESPPTTAPVPSVHAPARIYGIMTLSLSSGLVLAVFTMALPLITDAVPFWFYWILLALTLAIFIASSAGYVRIQRLWNKGRQDPIARALSYSAAIVSGFALAGVIVIAFWRILAAILENA